LQQSDSSNLGPTPPVVPPPPAPDDDDDFQINADDIRVAPPPPPQPRVVVEDAEVEDVRISLSDAGPLVRQVFGGMPEFFSQPWVAFAVPTIVFLVLYGAARHDANAAVVFLGMSVLYAATIGLLVVVLAFCEGVGTGLLTLFLPFYVLYFVYSINENRFVKALYTAMLLVGALLAWSLFDTLNLAQLLQQIQHAT